MAEEMLSSQEHCYSFGELIHNADVVRYLEEKGLQVTQDTPPAFILASSDDDLVPVRNSILYYNALVDHGVSATMHLYPVGGHGWCWRDNFLYKPQYVSELGQWLSTFLP